MTLPHGFTVTLADDLLTTRRRDVLLGGSPLTALHLAPAALRLIDRRTVTVRDAASEHLARRLLATNLGYPDLAHVPPATTDQITVVIPVRDRPDQLDRCLSALDGLVCVVVDDASLDPCAVAKVVAGHGAACVAIEHNVGPAAARNAGLTRVTTPYVAFVDSDVQITAKELLGLTRHFADPELVLVGPRVVGRPVSSQPRWFERYDAAASSLTLGSVPSNVRPGATVAWLPSACLVARTYELGSGFNPRLRVGEDVDLIWRLVDAGKAVRYDPKVTAHHDTRATLRGWLGRKYVYGTGGGVLAALHGNKIAPAILSPASAAAAAAILLRTRWSPLAAVGAWILGTCRVGTALPSSSGGRVMAARVSARGFGWAIQQESALALRHWWPAAALSACFSGKARRALVTALVIDSVVALRQQRTAPTRVAPGVFLAGRRLDDLAYGAGLTWGAIRARSLRALLPRRR